MRGPGLPRSFWIHSPLRLLDLRPLPILEAILQYPIHLVILVREFMFHSQRPSIWQGSIFSIVAGIWWCIHHSFIDLPGQTHLNSSFISYLFNGLRIGGILFRKMPEIRRIGSIWWRLKIDAGTVRGIQERAWLNFFKVWTQTIGLQYLVNPFPKDFAGFKFWDMKNFWREFMSALRVVVHLIFSLTWSSSTGVPIFYDIPLISFDRASSG